MKLIIPLILLVTWCNMQSQIYPIQLNVQLSNPHPVYLPELAGNGNDFLRIELEFNDQSEPSVEVKLFIELSGQGFTIRTRPLFQPAVTTLTSGVPYLLSDDELGEYLKSENLEFSGISATEYEDRKVFPEGQYSICLKAIHYWNPGNVQISNEQCLNDWFILNDPPLPDLPFCGSNVSINEPQQILFQWTPMHLASPNLLNPPEYLFELWEIFPTNADPQQVVNSSFPLFSITTEQSFYNYSFLNPFLIEGKKYVWRVTVQDVNGAMLFNNEGKSTLCNFLYTSFQSNSFILSLNAQPTSHRQALLWWNEYSFMNHYILAVRKQGFQDWFEIGTDSGNFRLNDLEPASTYEARVKGLIGMEETEWSNTITFTTFSLPVYSCNSISIPPDLLSSPPLQQAHIGMIFKVGQFELKSTSITSGSLPGYYSGLGTISVTFGVKLNVEFQSVYIDMNQTIVGGEVNALSSGINNWSNQWEYEDAWFFSGEADSIFTQNGIIYIINEDGDTTMITEDYSGGLLITDQNGDQWLVNPDGSVVPVPNSGLLPVSTVPLNAQEMEILSRALDLIRNQFAESTRDSLIQVASSKESALNTHLSTQQNFLNAAGENVGDIAFVGFNPSIPISTDAGSQLNKTFKEFEFNSNLGKILFVISRELDTPGELNYLGRYLTVSGQVFSAFVTQKTAEGLTNSQIAALTAEQGIKLLVGKVVRKKMTFKE